MIPQPSVTPMLAARLALMFIVLLAALPVGAQRPASVPMVGFVGPNPAGPVLDGFRQGLQQLGYVEGQNIAIAYRFSEGRGERFAGLIEELVRLNAEVIVTAGFSATIATKRVALAIPVVFGVADPMGSGIGGAAPAISRWWGDAA